MAQKSADTAGLQSGGAGGTVKRQEAVLNNGNEGEKERVEQR